MRYYDKATHNETSEVSGTTVPETNSSVTWWFQALSPGEQVLYWTDDLPYKYTGTLYEPVVVDGIVVEGKPQDDIDEDLLTNTKRSKSVEIVTTQKDMAIAFWSDDGTTYSMTKQKIDTNTRVSELQALTAPTQDETDELVEYGSYFIINKTTNSERYTFLNDVDGMTTVAEVDAYIYEYSAYPDVTNQTDESLTNAQFFIRYGFIMAT